MNKTNMATPSMGFTPEDMKNISNVLGYTGEPSGFADYLSKNPQAHDSFMGIQKQRLQFDNGGFVATQHMANGGLAQGQYASDDPVLDDFLNSGYFGGTPFFDESTGQYIPSLTLSDGRTLTREQFDSMRSGSDIDARKYHVIGNTSQQLPQEQIHVMTNPDGSMMNEEDMARYDARIAARGQSNIVTPIGQQGPSPLPTQQAPPTTGQVDLSNVNAPQIGVETAQRLQQPALPAGGVYTAAQTPTEAAQSVAPSTALITGDVRVAEAGQAQAAQAIAPTATTAAAITAAQAAPDVRDVAAQTAAAQQAAPTQAITAAQQADTAVSQLQAAQTAATQVQAPTPRQLGAGEVIAAPTGQAAQAATFVQPTAAVGTPSSQATVQGQLCLLYTSPSPRD